MSRFLVLAYGLLCYLLFLGTTVYAMGFIGNLGTPTSIDPGAEGTGSVLGAVLVNLGVLTLFAIQHSGMARPAFKRWWTQVIPEPMERSTYVLLTVAVMGLLFWQWRPIAGVVWHVETPWLRTALTAFYLSGYAMVVYATILISHFDLFGLRQVALFAQKKTYEHLPFGTPSLYRYVRHPLYVGWFVVFWATPTMTVGHLLFAAVCTTYILVAIQLEERDLVGHFGAVYDRYRKSVPMFLPRPGRTAPTPAPAPATAVR